MAWDKKKWILKELEKLDNIGTPALETMIRQTGVIRTDRVREYMMWLEAVGIINHTHSFQVWNIDKEVVQNEMEKLK